MTFTPITTPHYLFQQETKIPASRIDFLPFLAAVFEPSLLNTLFFTFYACKLFSFVEGGEEQGKRGIFRG